MSRDGLVALPRGAMGLSAVCDCGISISYSLTFFKASDSTCFRLHQNSYKAPAISSRHDLKSIGKGNLFVGPLHIRDRILESVIIFQSPVTM